MGIGALRSAIIFLVFIYMVPSQACQPERYINSAVDLEDGEHVFAIVYNREAAFAYPVSGVYRKGPDKQLVWEYHGRLDESRLQDSISASGRYFVGTYFFKVEVVSEFPFAALSIYDNGKLIRDFHWDTFTDDIVIKQDSSQLFAYKCWPAEWANMQYDKANDQLRVESNTGRVVTIDVPSAQILSVDYVVEKN